MSSENLTTAMGSDDDEWREDLLARLRNLETAYYNAVRECPRVLVENDELRERLRFPKGQAAVRSASQSSFGAVSCETAEMFKCEVEFRQTRSTTLCRCNFRRASRSAINDE